MIARSIAAGSALILAGCASVPKDGGRSVVQAALDERLGRRVEVPGAPGDLAAADRVRALLAKPLDPEAAVEIALLNSPRVRAAAEGVGVAVAELTRAGTLRNPRLETEVRFRGDGRGTAAEVGLEFAILDVLFAPLRAKAAGVRLEQAQLRAAGELFRTATDVRAAVLAVQATRMSAELQQAVTEAARAAAELAQKQHEARNITDLAWASELALYEQARLDLAEARVEAALARDRLSALLGLFGPALDWKMDAQMDELPREDPSLEKLEAAAIRQRLDLAVLRLERDALERELSLAGNARWASSIGVGVHVEREPSGETSVGPELSMELPLFDRGQGAAGALEARLRRANSLYEDGAVRARAEVRMARTRLVSTRATVDHYRRVLLPLRERIVALSQLQYNAMSLSPYQLLASRQDQIRAMHQYLGAVRRYWEGRSELEQALRGGIGGAMMLEPSGESRDASDPTAGRASH